MSRIGTECGRLERGVAVGKDEYCGQDEETNGGSGSWKSIVQTLETGEGVEELLYKDRKDVGYAYGNMRSRG